MALIRSTALIPTSLLEAAGYSFHQGAADDRPDLGTEAWWFCWAGKGTDVECGRGCRFFDEAVTDALLHWFNNTHPMHTEFVKQLAAQHDGPEPDFDTFEGGVDEFEDLHERWQISADARAVLDGHKLVLNPKDLV